MFAVKKTEKNSIKTYFGFNWKIHSMINLITDWTWFELNVQNWMQPKSCSSELPYDSVSEQDFVLVHQSKLKKNMFYCIELNLRTRWSVGRSIGRSVGQSVGRPVGLSVCHYFKSRLMLLSEQSINMYFLSRWCWDKTEKFNGTGTIQNIISCSTSLW